MATETSAGRYAVVYARGVAHIQGLDEKVTTGMDSLYYARSACPALSKSVFWCTALRTDDLSAAVEKALEIARVGITTGVCKKCLKTAIDALHAEALEVERERAERKAASVDIPMVAVFVHAEHAEAFYQRMINEGGGYRVRDVVRENSRTVRFVGEDNRPEVLGYESYTWSMMECVGYFGSPPMGPVATLNGAHCPRSY